MADSNIDAVERFAVVTSLENSLLVDDSIDSNGSLSSLSVTNDKLTLSSANGNLLI